ncbi:NAD(P)/FAD-dependent oxidoreductase [Brucella gallinifaecis]|uniref:FAD-binding oxidoreductase n=1 Tax=Brucella gallinifaecis TaxID=215590 RepID=A0A502BM30_9HYPH|nr:FAD-binding oxidoreductase [Brucella gallinifaecis]TPF74701.1 FAD-binding oxidoreductase [Brucella gallinifaecis]
MTQDQMHHWRKISKEQEFKAVPLYGETVADVVVIGAGFTGLNAAIELAISGARVIVLEGADIGQAASGRNNGQVIPHHSKKSPSEFVELLGKKRGDLYNEMVATAPLRLFDLISRYKIKCDLVSQGWMQACHSLEALKRAEIFHKEWKALGCKVEWLDRASIAEKVGGGDFLGGWKAFDAGYLNPYALTQGLARAAAQEGATIHTQSMVKAIEKEGNGWIVKTDTGRVRTAKVLVAANAVAGHFWPSLHKAMIPVRVYQIATAPFSADLQKKVLPGREGVSDTSRDIRAFRYDSTGALAMVGSHTVWFNAAERGKSKVMRRLTALLPQVPNVPAAEYWEGVIAVVPDKVPRLMELAPGVIFAGIYSGRGIAMSTVWGRNAAQILTGRLSDSAMPMPVSGLKTVAGHGVGVQVARFIHPWHRLQDRLDKRD